MNKFACWLLIVVCIAFVPATAPARLIESWPYEKLFKESDLVVIAVPGKSETADDKAPDHS